MARAPDPRIEQAKAMYLNGKKLIEYLQDNNKMSKAKEFLRTLKETIPGF